MKFSRFLAQDRHGTDNHESQILWPRKAVDSLQNNFGANPANVAKRETQDNRPAHFTAIPGWITLTYTCLRKRSIHNS